MLHHDHFFFLDKRCLIYRRVVVHLFEAHHEFINNGTGASIEKKSRAWVVPADATILCDNAANKVPQTNIA